VLSPAACCFTEYGRPRSEDGREAQGRDSRRGDDGPGKVKPTKHMIINNAARIVELG